MINLIKLNVKDEILASEELYTIKDSTGRIVAENVKIDLVTYLVQNGTELNKVLFDKIDENFEKLKKRILSKEVGDSIYDYFVKGQAGEFMAPDTLNKKYKLDEFEDNLILMRESEQEQDDIKAEVSNLNSEVSNLDSDISSLETRVKKIENSI